MFLSFGDSTRRIEPSSQGILIRSEFGVPEVAEFSGADRLAAVSLEKLMACLKELFISHQFSEFMQHQRTFVVAHHETVLII